MNITMATSDLGNSLYFPTFTIGDGDMINSVGTRWKKYVSRFDNFLIALNITEEKRKRALLLHFGGFELQDIHDSLDTSGETYDTLKTALAHYFEPRTNDSFEIFNFQKTIQKDGETLQAYHTRLREMAGRCGFDDKAKHIKTQLILGTNSSKLRKFCFSNKDASLQDILNRGKLLQDVDYQSKELEMKLEVKKEPKNVPVLQIQLKEQVNKLNVQGKRNFHLYRPHEGAHSKTCYNCGNPWPHRSSCPAAGKSCKCCRKQNHFARVCRSKHQKIPAGSIRPLNFVDNEMENPSLEYTQKFLLPPNTQEAELFTVVEINATQKVSHKLATFQTKIMIGGQPISCLIDTGCSTNILNLATYKHLIKFKPFQLKKSKVSLITYGEDANSTKLKALGTIHCLAESGDRLIDDEFFVVDTKATNLIGGQLALKLNL